MVIAGLISSLGHLGKPQRVWRALSQWRSSWLSREGVCAILTFIPAIAIIGHWIVDASVTLPSRGPDPWYLLRSDALIEQSLGIALALGSAITVFCTANIYSCLKPVRAWHNKLVVPTFLLIAIYSGLLLAWIAFVLPGWMFFGRVNYLHQTQLLFWTLIVVSAIVAVLKLSYWTRIDEPSKLTTGDATGLGYLGNVRSFEHPHTEENYLTHEMGFRIARKHSRKLRLICLIAGFAVPGILALLSLLVPDLGFVAAWIALFSGLLGIFIERWLFFAEAKHAVMLYYGARSA